MGSEDAPLHPDDLVLLNSIRKKSDWLRAVLCTLARRGVSFRRAHPERAKLLLDALATYPFHKGGQFLFDLMEWEDFMIDGPAPEIVPATLDSATLFRLAGFLQSLQRHLDGAVGLDAKIEVEPTAPSGTAEELPPLEPGFHLYQDVVLGVLQSVAASLPREEG